MFKSGDKVEVSDPFSEWYGEIGEVVYVEAGYAYVGLDEAFDLIAFAPSSLRAVDVMEVKTTTVDKLWSK